MRQNGPMLTSSQTSPHHSHAQPKNTQSKHRHMHHEHCIARKDTQKLHNTYQHQLPHKKKSKIWISTMAVCQRNAHSDLFAALLKSAMSFPACPRLIGVPVAAAPMRTPCWRIWVRTVKYVHLLTGVTQNRKVLLFCKMHQLNLFPNAH